MAKKDKTTSEQSILTESENAIMGEDITPQLNKVIYVRTRRKNGTLRIQQDFSYCPTLAEQHTAHLTDLNYLIEKYKPDELAAYIAARNQNRQEIIGHDFSREPDLQEAKNYVYRSQKAFSELPDDIKVNFKNHLEFLKFIDNPANADKMVKLGLLQKKQIDDLRSLEPLNSTTQRTPTQEKDDTAEKKSSSKA